jgi:hypothetical protein
MARRALPGISIAVFDTERERRRRADRAAVAMRPNKELKLTKPSQDGASQLNSVLG